MYIFTVFYCFIGLPSESIWSPSYSNGEEHTHGLGLQGDTHDRGTETAVQPRPKNHHVPHPRVQMVIHAPETAHWPVVCIGERRPCLEEVCEGVLCALERDREGVWPWCLCDTRSELTCHVDAVFRHIFTLAFSKHPINVFNLLQSKIAMWFYILWKMLLPLIIITINVSLSIPCSHSTKSVMDFVNCNENIIFVHNTIHLISQMVDNIIIACGGILPLLSAATSPNVSVPHCLHCGGMLSSSGSLL